MKATKARPERPFGKPSEAIQKFRVAADRIEPRTTARKPKAFGKSVFS